MTVFDFPIRPRPGVEGYGPGAAHRCACSAGSPAGERPMPGGTGRWPIVANGVGVRRPMASPRVPGRTSEAAPCLELSSRTPGGDGRATGSEAASGRRVAESAPEVRWRRGGSEKCQCEVAGVNQSGVSSRMVGPVGKFSSDELHQVAGHGFAPGAVCVPLRGTANRQVHLSSPAISRQRPHRPAGLRHHVPASRPSFASGRGIGRYGSGNPGAAGHHRRDPEGAEPARRSTPPDRITRPFLMSCAGQAPAS